MKIALVIANTLYETLDEATKAYYVSVNGRYELNIAQSSIVEHQSIKEIMHPLVEEQLQLKQELNESTKELKSSKELTENAINELSALQIQQKEHLISAKIDAVLADLTLSDAKKEVMQAIISSDVDAIKSNKDVNIDLEMSNLKTKIANLVKLNPDLVDKTPSLNVTISKKEPTKDIKEVQKTDFNVPFNDLNEINFDDYMSEFFNKD